MEKTVNLGHVTAATGTRPDLRLRREPRPFLYLDSRAPRPVDPSATAALAATVGEHVPVLARALINHTIALQKRRQLETGWRRPIAVSVLNRRRRAARAWIQAILAGRIDDAAQRSVAFSWIPQLAASGPDVRMAVSRGRSCVEFLRGAITGIIFDRAANNLVPEAKALWALETVLGAHLRALRAAAQQAWSHS